MSKAKVVRHKGLRKAPKNPPRRAMPARVHTVDAEPEIRMARVVGALPPVRADKGADKGADKP